MFSISPLLLASLLFGFGMQSYYMLGRKLTKEDCISLAAIVLLSLFSFFYLSLNIDKPLPPFNNRFLLSLFVYLFSFTAWFKSRLLPVITEYTVLLTSLTAFYIVTTIDTFSSPFLLLLFFSITLFSCILAVFHFRLSPVCACIFYILFLFTITFLGFFQITSLFVIGDGLSTNGLDMVFASMSIFSLAVYMVYIFLLIPLPNKYRTFTQAFYQSKEECIALLRCFDHRQTNPIVATLTIVLFLIFGLLALRFPLLLSPETFIYSTSLLASFTMQYGRNS